MLHQVMFYEVRNIRLGIGICCVRWSLGEIRASNVKLGGDYFMMKIFYEKNHMWQVKLHFSQF